ncbi:MAG TPA: alpha/beta hydrolase [Patescibacteria group bacterium]|nr:alpha/beta hydrolase [Patescibacteria group bacterium]
MANSKPNPADFIVSLNVNGLQGRMLQMPAPNGKSREIMFVYGHHSSLERWWGLVQDLNQYGAVTMPDLPGFGGMETFYKLGKKPTVDNLADYLAAFVKMRYKRKKVTIVGLSFGFVVVTRMLQRYPDLTKKVDVLISVVGFAHKDDFSFSKSRWRFYRYTAGLVSHQLPAIFFENVFLHPLVLRLAYHRTHNAKEKFEGLSRAERRATMKFEVHLWHANDVRTWAHTTREFLQLDNCGKKVDLPVWHVSVQADRYFDNHSVEQHLNVIFNEVHVVKAKAANHAPSVVAEMESVAPLIPPKIREVLAKA